MSLVENSYGISVAKLTVDQASPQVKLDHSIDTVLHRTGGQSCLFGPRLDWY